MTPGQQALAEAARLEAARVYSRTVREDRPVAASPAKTHPRTRFESDVMAWRAQGNTAAEIALRLGQPRQRVADVLARLERAS